MSDESFWNYTNETNSSDSDSDDYCAVMYVDPLKSWYFKGTVYLMYIIIFTIAMLGNGFLCYIVLSSPRMQTVTNYFILNLAVGDILITILCVPFTSVSLLEQHWPFPSYLCPIVSYSQALAVFVSAYTLVAISIDKYMIILWPLKPRISKKFAVSVIGLIWLIAATTVLPISTFTKLIQPSMNESKHKICDLYICVEDYEEIGVEYGVLYTKILMFLQYIIPCAVLLFTYTSIGIVIWCHRIPGEAENSRDQRIARSKRKMIKMMVVVVFVYTLCWLPYNVFLVMQSSINEKMLPYLFFILHGLAMSHACYNPLIYCYMNSRFRAGFLQALSTAPCCRRCLTSPFVHLASTSNNFPPTANEGTDNTLLQRSSSSSTYISMKRKTCPRPSACNHQLPVRSASLMRNSSGNQQNVRRVRYRNNIVDEQI